MKRTIDTLSGIPLVMRPGLLVFTLGGAIDLVYHVASPEWAGFLETLLGQYGFLAHLAILVGMGLILAGLVLGELFRQWHKRDAGRADSHRVRSTAASESLSHQYGRQSPE